MLNANSLPSILRTLAARLGRHADKMSTLNFVGGGGVVVVARNGNETTPDVALNIRVTPRGFLVSVQYDGNEVAQVIPSHGKTWSEIERLFLSVAGWEARN